MLTVRSRRPDRWTRRVARSLIAVGMAAGAVACSAATATAPAAGPPTATQTTTTRTSATQASPTQPTPTQASPILASAAQTTATRTSVTRTAPTTPPTDRPRHWTVLALGDSVTAGTACNCTPFPQVYAGLLSKVRGVPTSVDNLGAPGSTSTDLLEQVALPTSPTGRALAGADIDLITIGANDFGDNYDPITKARCSGPDATDCADDELDTLRTNINGILTKIRQARTGRPTAILVTGYWNVFKDGQVARAGYPPAGVKATRALTLRANTVLREVTVADGASYIGLYTAFNGPAADGDVTHLLAADGDHPNAQGHILIAQRLLAAGLPGLVSG